MRIEKVSGSEERAVLTGMIVDSAVLGRVAGQWSREGLFASRWANLVGGWCCKYHGRYDKAPASHVQSLFAHWAEKGKDKDTIALVERFLGHLSGEYSKLKKRSNSAYTIDLAAKHFNRVRLAKLAEAIQGSLDDGDVEAAEARASAAPPIELGGAMGVDVLQDKAAMKAAFAARGEALFLYPGPLGKFLGHAFKRDSFIAVMAIEKNGKSYLLQDFAFQAMYARQRVAYFQIGDLSEAQQLQRFAERVARRPLRSGSYRVPCKITRQRGHSPVVVYKKKSNPKQLTYREVMAAAEQVMQRRVKSEDSYLRLATHANDTCSVADIAAALATWSRDGWTPDVVIVDYADLLVPPAGIKESRDQHNANWKRLRALSQKMHCCLITASQANSAAAHARLLTRSHFSEDRRKLAHVTDMLGINKDDEERAAGRMRLNWLLRRDEVYDPRRCIHVAGSLAIASPCMVASL